MHQSHTVLFARNNISAFLVCATTITNDGIISDPFLYVIGHPTVYSLGQTRTTTWKHTSDPWSSAVLTPVDIQGPKLAAHRVMGTNTHPSLRCPTSLAGNRSLTAYLSKNIVLCFSDSGRLFNPVVAPAASAPAARSLVFDDRQKQLVSAYGVRI
jgi:hypothetical protein